MCDQSLPVSRAAWTNWRKPTRLLYVVKDQIDTLPTADQLGRRNITPDEFTLILGRRYNRQKKAHGGQLPNKGIDQIEPSLSTADRLAAQHGVSSATVKRAGQYAVAIVEKAAPGETQNVPRTVDPRRC